MNCVIICPIYKSFPDQFELKSFNQCIKVLFTHPICIVTHDKLDISYYTNVLSSTELFFFIEYFDEDYFTSIQTYNRLMTSLEFYQRFNKFDHMLIYQLDAYVFSDKLKFWSNKGYSYIGAPFPEDVAQAEKKRYLSEFNAELKSNIFFNGGFSLRKINSFIEIIQKNKALIDQLFEKNWYEDEIFGILFYQLKKEKFPDLKTAIEFSFECTPSIMYEKNNKTLPMGCHAWYRGDGENYDNQFWYRHIIPFQYFKIESWKKIQILKRKLRNLTRLISNFFKLNIGG